MTNDRCGDAACRGLTQIFVLTPLILLPPLAAVFHLTVLNSAEHYSPDWQSDLGYLHTTYNQGRP